VARLVLPALALAYGAAAAALVINAGDFPTTYASASAGAATADLVVGLGLIAAGAFAWTERSRGSIGAVTILLGVVWLTPDWVGWEDGPVGRMVRRSCAVSR
jgi:hypothetical protein